MIYHTEALARRAHIRCSLQSLPNNPPPARGVPPTPGSPTSQLNPAGSGMKEQFRLWVTTKCVKEGSAGRSPGAQTGARFKLTMRCRVNRRLRSSDRLRRREDAAACADLQPAYAARQRHAAAPLTLSCASRECSMGTLAWKPRRSPRRGRLHALVAEKLRRGNGGTGAACGEDSEL